MHCNTHCSGLTHLALHCLSLNQVHHRLWLESSPADGGCGLSPAKHIENWLFFEQNISSIKYVIKSVNIYFLTNNIFVHICTLPLLKALPLVMPIGFGNCVIYLKLLEKQKDTF